VISEVPSNPTILWFYDDEMGFGFWVGEPPLTCPGYFQPVRAFSFDAIGTTMVEKREYDGPAPTSKNQLLVKQVVVRPGTAQVYRGRSSVWLFHGKMPIYPQNGSSNIHIQHNRRELGGDPSDFCGFLPKYRGVPGSSVLKEPCSVPIWGHSCSAQSQS